MQGVTALSSNFRIGVGLASGATQVAAWTNSVPLIAFKGDVVAINAYIGAAAMWSGQFSRVMVNAFNWLCTPPPPPPPPPPPQAPPAPAPLVPAAPAPVLAPSKAPPPTLMRPFPVVRIRGYFATTGARITLLSVRGPHSAQITVRCFGKGCPVPSLSLPSAPARLHPFERFLRAGTRLEVSVGRPGRIGKYTSFLIRAHRKPLRTDRCLMPGRSKPTRCPTS
jgi:hypothetical protein